MFEDLVFVVFLALLHKFIHETFNIQCFLFMELFFDFFRCDFLFFNL